MIRCLLLAAAVLAGLLTFPSQGQACLANYRSPESLAVSSPLILVGEITSVEDGPPLKFKGMFGMENHGDDGKFTIATVQVLRVIKGTYKDRTIQIGSGPIASCAPYAVFTRFTKGEKFVFLLPEEPFEGFACLRKQGSMREVGDTELIESCLARATQYKASYLALVKRDAPQVYADGVALAKKMTKAVSNWPKQKCVKHSSEGQQEAIVDASGRIVVSTTPASQPATAPDEEAYYTFEDTPEREKAIGALADELSKVKIEVIRTALAIAWVESTWPREHIWEQAMGRLAEKRADEILPSRRAYFRGILEAAGVEKKYVDSYLKAAKIDKGPLVFPVQLPDAFNKKLEPEDFTTEFILFYHQYDRGSMFIWYGMGFESLKDLQAARVADAIPAMCGSKDERLSLVGFRAIQYAHGDEFVGTIVSEMMGKTPYAWRYLVVEDKERTQKRLKALAELGKSYDGFWMALENTRCFAPVLIDTAVSELKEVPNRKLEKYRLEWIQKALNSYLILPDKSAPRAKRQLDPA